MIQYLKFKYRLAKLFRSADKQRAYFDRLRGEMRLQKAPRDDFGALNSQESAELSITEYEIEALTTEYYLRRARQMFIEVPDRDDESAWTESSLDPYRKVLSNAGISRLRSQIMTYRKERNEQVIPLVTAMTGLIGTIIGLVALL